jgi:hypothetical protein
VPLAKSAFDNNRQLGEVIESETGKIYYKYQVDFSLLISFYAADSPRKKKQFVRRCFVPQCGATDANSVGKIMICITKVEAQRNEVCLRMSAAMGKDFQLGKSKRTVYGCSDHYDVSAAEKLNLFVHSTYNNLF